MSGGEAAEAASICFGLDRETDERSLAAFLRLVADKKLADVLIPRLDASEIEQIVDMFTTIMHHHLSEQEYHRLVLGDREH